MCELDKTLLLLAYYDRLIFYADLSLKLNILLFSTKYNLIFSVNAMKFAIKQLMKVINEPSNVRYIIDVASSRIVAYCLYNM